MWKAEKSRQSFVPDQPANAIDQIDPPDAPAADTPGYLRGSSGNSMLDELRGQPGFGVVVSAGDLHPATPQPPSIGQRMSVELDALSRRDRQVREMKELATSRVVDLTTEQLRRILEFML